MPTISSTSPAPPLTEAQALAIRAEGIRALYQSMPASYLGSAVMATLLAAILAPDMPALYWGPWLAAMYLQAVARWQLRRRFLALSPPSEAIARWGHLAMLGSLVSGGIWGFGAILGFAEARGIMQFVWVPMVIMLGSVSTYAATPYLPAFYAFFYPAALPGIALFLARSDQLRFLLGVAFLCFVPLVTHFAHVLHRSFVDSMRLRFENSGLIDALQAEKTAAEEANRAKSRFLAAASHDLRQPMHALSLFVESLSSSTALPPHEATLVGHIRNSAEAMGSLFDSLLDMSRLDAGIVEARPEHFALRPFARRLQEEFGPVAHAAGLQLRVRAVDGYAHTDPMLLKRIVSNLLVNGIRHGARVGVLLAIRRHRGGFAVEVWDTGIGIAVHEYETVFQEFYQVGNPERDRSKGLGLGLAIVRRLVRLLDLQLTLRSRLGQGSLFRVVVAAGIATEGGGATAIDTMQPASALAGVFVLVIDDEEAVCSAMASLLSGWGCAVLTATSSTAMKERLLSDLRVPDLIICDYRMRGGENGITVIEDLRAEYNHDIPGLIVTGDTLPECLQEARASNLPVLHKPIQAGKLRAVVTGLTMDSRPTEGAAFTGR